MKILIVTIGTRGDVQPYIALGRALMESGNDVTICTCTHFEPFVRKFGLGYAYINNDFINFMHTPEGKILLGNAGSTREDRGIPLPEIGLLAQTMGARRPACMAPRVSRQSLVYQAPSYGIKSDPEMNPYTPPKRLPFADPGDSRTLESCVQELPEFPWCFLHSQGGSFLLGYA